LCALCPPLYCPGAVYNVGQACDAQPDRISTLGDWRPRRTLRAEAAAHAMLARLSTRITKAKRACSRLVRFMSPIMLFRRYAPAASAQSVVLSHASGLPAIVAGWTWCATSTASAAAASASTTTMHSPAHRRLRQALRRQRCTARPLFTRPAWPRSALRSPTRTT
jgi:hypothetical protein